MSAGRLALSCRPRSPLPLPRPVSAQSSVRHAHVLPPSAGASVRGTGRSGARGETHLVLGG